MNRTSVNGLQPRELREVAPDPYDWTDAPLFDGPSRDWPDLIAKVVTGLAAALAIGAMVYSITGPA
jgi:hypothetical protein